MNWLIVVVFFVFCISGRSQNPENFNEIYTKTYLETSQIDFPKALQVADSLLITSKTPLFQTKSLMLSASLHQQSGDLKKAIDCALKGEKIIIQTNNYVWISRVYGFLATQYRLSGLYAPSQKYAQLAYKYAEKISEKELSRSTLAHLLQEMAYNEIVQRNYRKALQYLNDAKIYFEEINQNRAYLIAQNEQLIGFCYLNLAQTDSATLHYHHALQVYGDLPENYTKGLIYNGIARVHLTDGNLEKAKENLELAQRIADSSSYLELKSEVYKTSQDYYIAAKDIESLSNTRIKQKSVYDEIEKKKSHFLNESFSEIRYENSRIQEVVNTKNKLLLLVVILLSVGIVFFVIYRKNQKRKIGRIKGILEKIEEADSAKSPPKPSGQITKDKTLSTEDLNSESINSRIMPPSTEEKILKKLEKFENSGLYTQNTISLSYLATYCETNSKYLSYVINTHKKQDFNNYINELRINYIIRKLNNNPLYRRYKIASLAEEAGFSSQNKFATIFKKATAISPSAFIQYLENHEYNN